jgi:glutathione S-transferase
MSTERAKLTVRWFCPFVQRAWIALEEGKVPYQYKEVNPYKKEVTPCLNGIDFG